MAKEFFNQVYFDKIQKNCWLNPISSLADIENYIEQYPKDYMAQYLLVKQLILLEKYEEAEKLLEETDKRVNEHIINDEHRKNTLKMSLAYCKTKLDLVKGDWEQALKDAKFYEATVKSTDHTLSESTASNIVPFVIYKLGKERSIQNYYSDQLYDYSFELFKSHVKENHQDENPEIDDQSKFYDYIDTDVIFDEAKRLLPSFKRYFKGVSDESIFIKYDSCGRSRNKDSNFIEICIAYGTDMMITSYPKREIGEYEYLDFNYLKEKVEGKQEIKNNQLSRSQKFFNKYNIKK